MGVLFLGFITQSLNELSYIFFPSKMLFKLVFLHFQRDQLMVDAFYAHFQQRP